MTRRDSLRLLAAAPLMSGARLLAGDARERHHFERGLMGTRFAVTCYHEDSSVAQAAAEEAFQAAASINAVASDYIADSELLGISAQPPRVAFRLSPLLFRLLAEARAIAETTGGLFDPTLGPVTRLWRETRRRQQLPEPAVVEDALATCGWQKFHLDAAERTITLDVAGMRFDLGGIAKGQAADAMLEVLKRHGIGSACITAGGDVRAGDPPPGEKGWSVAVRSQEEGEMRKILLSHRAVSTSGDLHQSIEIGGVRYSHIVDPATGLGLTRPAAATVIARTATFSDPLATACCVAEPDVARENAARWGVEELILN
jgi:FAD:protein FMN transferase